MKRKRQTLIFSKKLGDFAVLEVLATAWLFISQILNHVSTITHLNNLTKIQTNFYLSIYLSASSSFFCIWYMYHQKISAFFGCLPYGSGRHQKINWLWLLVWTRTYIIIVKIKTLGWSFYWFGTVYWKILRGRINLV